MDDPKKRGPKKPAYEQPIVLKALVVFNLAMYLLVLPAMLL